MVGKGKEVLRLGRSCCGPAQPREPLLALLESGEVAPAGQGMRQGIDVPWGRDKDTDQNSRKAVSCDNSQELLCLRHIYLLW